MAQHATRWMKAKQERKEEEVDRWERQKERGIGRERERSMLQ